jgi:hypothetical protein
MIVVLMVCSTQGLALARPVEGDMGLDQYMCATDEHITAETLYAEGNEDARDEFGYWRKHADLHGHIEKLWEDAGYPGLKKEAGSSAFGSDFNCVPFELSEEQLQHILECSKKQSFGSADRTTGFFFGETYPKKHEATVEIVERALELKREGKRIFYDSWW